MRSVYKFSTLNYTYINKFEEMLHMDTTNNTMGKRIATIRKSNKYTQERLAELLDVTPKHISHVENGSSSLSLKSLLKFCEHFECSMDYLVNGKYTSPELNKLPAKIIEILQNGNDDTIELLDRYLQMFVELYGEK